VWRCSTLATTSSTRSVRVSSVNTLRDFGVRNIRPCQNQISCEVWPIEVDFPMPNKWVPHTTIHEVVLWFWRICAACIGNSYRCFGTTYRTHLHGSSSSSTVWEQRMGPIVCLQTWKETAIIRFGKSKIVQISFTPWRNPEILQPLWYFLRTKSKWGSCFSRYCFGLTFSIIIPLMHHRLLVQPSSGRWTVSPSIRVALVLRHFNAPYKFTPLLKLHPLIFGIKPFGWLRSIMLTST